MHRQIPHSALHSVVCSYSFTLWMFRARIAGLMGRRNTSRRRYSGTGVAARRAKIPAVGLPAQPTASPRSEPLLQRKYRELMRQHLGKLLNHLFTEFTSLHFHIAWAPSLSREWDPRALPSA